ncbi:MAG: xylulokinase [Armatimonadetes bacterium]|nr:xylulokinase [Armatimonadota bacterium]
MDRAILLGIDLGTSAVKTLAVTPQGQVVGRGSGTYDIEWVREGWAEQDPEAWWAATASAVRQAVDEATNHFGGSRKAEILAVSLSGQVNGVVVLDEAGRVLRPAVIWLDQRSAAEAEHINHAAADLLPQTVLGKASAIHAAAKLLWLLRHESARLGAAWKVLFPKDFVTYRLTGQAITEVTDAGASGLLDLSHRRWAAPLLERLGIPGLLLPEVTESPTVVGQVHSDAAEALGIPPGTPVVAGAGDMAAITAGTGVIAPGIGCAIIGTAGQVALFTESCPRTCPDGLWAMTHPMPGAYFWHGLVMTAGYSLAWLAGVLGTGRYDRTQQPEGAAAVALLAEQAKGSPPGSRGLLFLPFLDGAATPHADPAARATFLGAASIHGRGDFARAVMEGVAFNFRDVFEVLAGLGACAVRIRIGGGGSRSDLWQQIMADVLGPELDVLEELEASALGAAVIASVGIGVFRDFASACSAMVRIRRNLVPDSGRRELYDDYYAVYRHVYSRVRDLSHALVRLGQRAP